MGKRCIYSPVREGLGVTQLPEDVFAAEPRNSWSIAHRRNQQLFWGTGEEERFGNSESKTICCALELSRNCFVLVCVERN